MTRRETTTETSEQQLLGTYYRAMSKISLLNSEQERDLAQRVRSGDGKARKKLAEANLRLVVSMALSYRRVNTSLADLIQEGNVGLMEAVDRFDLSFGVKFSTYAALWIRACILRSLARSSIVHTGLRDHWAVLRLRKQTSELSNKLGREANSEDLAKELGLDSFGLEKLQRKSQAAVVSLDAPLGWSEGTDRARTIGDTIAAADDCVEEAIDKETLHEQLTAALSTLTARQQRVLTLRFGLAGEEPMTLEEIGSLPEFDVSRERIRQIESQALKQIDGPLAAELFEHLA